MLCYFFLIFVIVCLTQSVYTNCYTLLAIDQNVISIVLIISQENPQSKLNPYWLLVIFFIFLPKGLSSIEILMWVTITYPIHPTIFPYITNQPLLSKARGKKRNKHIKKITISIDGFRSTKILIEDWCKTHILE